MLTKNPHDRMSVTEVLAHPWTRTHYQGPNDRIKKTSDSSGSVLGTIKDSTMVPYLCQIYNEEIELDLENRGFYNEKLEPVRTLP